MISLFIILLASTVVVPTDAGPDSSPDNELLAAAGIVAVRDVVQ
jgi:hypothetical protein